MSNFFRKHGLFALLLVFVLMMSALTGCKGSSGSAGPAGPAGPAGQDGGTVVNIVNMSPESLAALSMTGEVTSVTIASPPVVNFKVTDASGRGVTGLGVASGSDLSYLRFALAKLVPGANGSPDAWVSYMVTATSRPTSERVAANLVDNGDGSYIYTFAKNVTDSTQTGGVTYEPTLTHRLVIQVSGTMSGTDLNPINIIHDYVPAGGTVSTQREITTTAACNECHTKIGTTTPHGGRVDTRYCVVCHTSQRGIGRTEATTDASGNFTGSTYIVNGRTVGEFVNLVHKIHMAEELTKTGYNYGGVLFNEVTYPQDQRNCTKCHKASTDAPQGDNWKNKPSRLACGACHDQTYFGDAGSVPAGMLIHGGGTQLDDNACAGCHDAAAIVGYHLAVALPDPTDPRLGGTNTHTNAEYIAAAGMVPSGAAKIAYIISAITTTNNHPSITFKLQNNGTDMVFTAPTSTASELMPNFAGSPSVYFAWAEPQDGITAPADFNKTASGYIKKIWNGADTNSSMTGPDANGYYTIVLTSKTVPSTAVMLTGGVGYTYGSGSPPLVQTNLSAYPYDATTGAGGLSVPVQDVWKVATGKTGRRVVVDTAKCNYCHGALGVNPTFHAGQRNDAPTCSFCHNPGRNSSGWSANASTFVHAIHAAGKRAVPYTWAEVSATDGYFNVTYPAVLNNCEQCHVSGGYDFSGSMYTANSGAQGVSNMLLSTSATGTYSPTSTVSPYVVNDGVTNYGTAGASTNLVNSPVTAACFACHDSTVAKAHMQANGGSIYAPRSQALATPEQCMICHGPGRTAAISDVHK